MEEAEDRVGETLALDFQPTLDLVARDVLLIDGHVVGSEGVGALRPDHRHHLVVLVGDGVLGSLVRHGVDFVVDLFALGGVGGVVIDLVQRLDLLELLLLLGPVERAEMVGALEHQVLQIVGEARGFRRVVLAAHAHRDVGLDARHVLVHGHEDLKAVVQRVVDDVHRVVLVGLLVVILRESAGDQETADRQQQACDKVTFHNAWFILIFDEFFSITIIICDYFYDINSLRK